MWVVKDGDEIKGMFGMERRLVVEPCYFDGANGHALMTLTWIDGFLRSQAAGLALGGYEFFVGDENAAFQNLLAKHFPVHGREKPGKFYFRKFEV